MSGGRRFDVSGIQIVAGVLATVTGAVAASYLGVAGTVIGAAVMSIASTGGGAVYRYYLGRGARQVRKAAPVITQRTVERATAVGARSAARRGVPSDQPPGATEVGQDAGNGAEPRPGQDVHQADSERHAAGSADGNGDPADGDGKPGDHAGKHAHRAADPADREPGAKHKPGTGRRMRPGWLAAAIGAAGIFLGVIVAITVFELAAGKPLDAVVWHRSGSGTTVGGLVGGQGPARSRHTSPPSPTVTPSRHPASAAPGSTNTTPASPSPSPTSSSSSPSPSPSQSSSPSPSASRHGTASSTHTP